MGMFDPILQVVAKGLDVSLNPKATGTLILYLLGDPARDIMTATLLDDVLQGGLIIETIDGKVSLEYVKKLRAWAEDLAKG